MKSTVTIILFLCVLFTIVFLINSQKKTQINPVSRIQNAITLSPTTRQFPLSYGDIPAIPFQLPQGYTIHVFASGLGNPRDLQFTPDGTLLVSNPSANDVIALPDSNHDGVADTEKVIISGENHIHGLAFFHDKLYIADVNKVVRYNWDEQHLQATKDKVLFSLPENNDHNNRTMVFDATGNMFVSVGSTCNVCRESPEQGGSVFISNANGDSPQIFATGLRNAAFLALDPKTSEVWGTEMGRDYLGDNTPPDEINIIRRGKNYGWPNCYGNKIHDDSFDKNRYFQNPCNTTESPIFDIPAHSAPLGLAFITSPEFPSDWQGDLLVAYHGSWNSSVATGYKIVHMKVNGNSITGVDDFLTGFLPSLPAGRQGDASLGRPVDLIFDTAGNLYISDDKAGNIYIVQKG